MKLIAVTGTSEQHTNFLLNSINLIIELSGNKEEVKVESFNTTENPKEINPDLIFTQMNDPQGDESTAKYFGLLKWMSDRKHAYCMVNEHHPMGLHNYNNFRNIIIPMNMVFKPLRFEVDKEGKGISPAILIEKMRPKNEQKN